MSKPVVVIDPGHGGRAKVGGSSPNNAVGPNGLLEKDLTLDIAERVKPLIASVAEVNLTRERDVNLGLADRAKAARDAHAALFLSVHLNGWNDAAVDGTEAWVARSANQRSRDFAAKLLAKLAKATQVKNRGVQQSDFGVLLPDRHDPGTAACLAEIAFLTNPAQAKLLASDAYKQKIAEALAAAIIEQLKADATTTTRAQEWSGALGGTPATADWLQIEFEGLQKLKAPTGEWPFFLTIGGKTDQKAHFDVRIRNRSETKALYRPVLFVKFSKKSDTGNDVWTKIDLDGQAADKQFKRMEGDWTLGPDDSHVLHLAIDRARLERAYQMAPGNSMAELRLELEFVVMPGGAVLRQANQIRFALVRPLELLSGSKKLVGEPALTAPQFREYWVPVWSKQFTQDSDKPREVMFSIQSGINETSADTTTTTNQITTTTATETQVQFKPKIDVTFGMLAATGKQLLGSFGLEYSKKWSESVARQNTDQLSQLRSTSQITTTTHQLVFSIPPTKAGKTVSLYICPVYKLFTVKAIRFDGPDANGQATTRTEENIPLMSFSGWRELDPVVFDSAAPNVPVRPTAPHLPTPAQGQAWGLEDEPGWGEAMDREVTFAPEVITVSATRRGQLLAKAGWKQADVVVTLKDFRGQPMRGHQALAEFRSPGVAAVYESAPVSGGAVMWSKLWLKPEGTVRVLALSTGASGVVPEGVEQYKLPASGALKLEAVQDGNEVTVSAETSQEAAEKVGAIGKAGVNFEVFEIGGEVSGESERRKGSTRSVSWKVVLPTSTFKLRQL
ncbi:MAG: N-acetylmuramoyl-L-alanine amidase [Burkholderiales bacterium]|nr:N-acetylmuramoyl-L-alanine amidase [Burkholderiales bacterium]